MTVLLVVLAGIGFSSAVVCGIPLYYVLRDLRHLRQSERRLAAEWAALRAVVDGAVADFDAWESEVADR